MLNFKLKKENSRLKNTIQVVLFLALLGCVLFFVSYILTARVVEPYSTRNQFFQTLRAEDDDTIDVFFVGDSSAMKAVIPVQIWDKQKITSFMLSYSVMKPQEAYYDLKKVFKRQSPKYVFLETAFLVKMDDGDAEYGTKKTKEMVKFIEDELVGITDYYLPVMKYKSAWTGWGIEDIKQIPPKQLNSVYKGYAYSSTVCAFKEGDQETEKGIVSYQYNGDRYLDKIFRLCEKNNCELVLFTVPHISGWNQKKHRSITELAKKYGIAYVDYQADLSSLVPKFSWETDTEDGGSHLNYFGAQKTTESIGEYLEESCGLKKTELTEKQMKKWDADTNWFYDTVVE